MTTKAQQPGATQKILDSPCDHGNATHSPVSRCGCEWAVEFRRSVIEPWDKCSGRDCCACDGKDCTCSCHAPAAQQPSQAAMGAAREMCGGAQESGGHALYLQDGKGWTYAEGVAAIIDRHLSAERKEVREVLRDVVSHLGWWLAVFDGDDEVAQAVSGGKKVSSRAEALLSKMGGE